MLRNYLKVAIRNLGRQRAFTFINVTGLAVGITACLLIFLYVREELSYDRYHDNADRLYRLAAKTEGASFGDGIAKVADLWGPGAKAEVPEIADATRFVFFGQSLFERGSVRQYETNGLYADSSTLQMFSWPLLAGDPEAALVGPGKIVVTTSFAKRWFGDQNPMGQTLLADNATLLTVSGVMEDVPANSHFTFDFLVSLESYYHERRGDWISWNQFYTYILLDPAADPVTVARKFDAVLDRHLEAEAAQDFYPLLQPLPEIHLHSKLHREMTANSDIRYVYVFSTIAIFILLIACSNFVSLSTARAARRAQEVGVRKVSGADRGMLIRQFLGESILLTATALLVGWMFAFLLLDPFNEVAGKTFVSADLVSLPLLLGLVAAAYGLGAVAGIYPAFVLSSFRPVKVLKGETAQPGSGRLRKGLVVFQFTVTACLMIATAVVFGQLSYIQGKDLGFTKEQIIVVPTNELATATRFETIKTQLMKVPGVMNVSFSANRPGGSDWGFPVDFEGVAEDDAPSVRLLCVDHDFLATYEIEVVDGRGFSREFPTDTAAYVLNETAAKELGWTVGTSGRVGMPVINRDFGEVVGIVKDFHFRSMHERIGPLVLFIQPSFLNTFNIRLKPDAIDESLAGIESILTAHEPDFPFVYRFFDEQFDALHAAEERMGTVLGYFAILAILIACLGLFGLASFTAERRTKEIGIRKVLGASVSRILILMSADTALLVLIGVTLASPLGYLAMTKWLSGFAYAIDLQWQVFVYAGLAAMTLALGATALQSIRAAIADPVGSLRHD